AGGAGRATVAALARAGASHVRVLNRAPDRAAALVRDLAGGVGGTGLSAGDLREAAELGSGPWTIVVNATSLGHQGAEPLVHDRLLEAAAVAVDLAYDPAESPFMR